MTIPQSLIYIYLIRTPSTLEQVREAGEMWWQMLARQALIMLFSQLPLVLQGEQVEVGSSRRINGVCGSSHGWEKGMTK